MSYKFEFWRFGICISTSSVSCSSLRLHVFFFDQIDSCRLSPVVSKASAGAMEVVDLLRLPGGMSETALSEVILVLIHYLTFFTRKSDKTVTNLDLTTKDNETRDSFKKHIKCFAFIVASSVTNRIATIKAKRFICFLKESRVSLSFVVKSKLVTVLSLSLFTFLQLPLAASMILGLNYVRSDSRVVI